METNEIMNNEEIVDTVEEIMTETSSNGLKVAVEVMAIAGVCYGAYKLGEKVVVPGCKKLMTKFKKKSEKEDKDEVEE